jgi:hypothetical protein
MRSRAFIDLIGGAVAWPVRARAKQTGKAWRIEVISTPFSIRVRPGMMKQPCDLDSLEL